MPYVFVSYARAAADDRLEKFVHQLRLYVQVRMGCSPDEAVFIDTGIGIGEEWEVSLQRALATSKCFVALLSPSYLGSPTCVREWKAFEARLRSVPRPSVKGAGMPPLLFPVLWQPVDLPERYTRIQWNSGELGQSYGVDGLRHLMHFDPVQYETFIEAFCRSVYESFVKFDLPTDDRLRFWESERSRWRRRFMWGACTVGMVLTAGVAIHVRLEAASRNAARRDAEAWFQKTAYSEDPLAEPHLAAAVLASLGTEDTFGLIRRGLEESTGTARLLLDDAEKRWPKDPQVWTLDGSWYYQMKSYPQALDAFARAIQLGAGPNAYQSRAKCKLQLGDVLGSNADKLQACRLGAHEGCGGL